MTKFNFQLEKSWDVAKRILAYATENDVDYIVGVEKLKKLWESKLWMLPYLNPKTGRIVAKITHKNIQYDEFNEVQNNLREFANKLKLSKERFNEIDTEGIVNLLANTFYHEKGFNLFENRIECKILMPNSKDRYFEPGTKYTKYLHSFITSLASNEEKWNYSILRNSLIERYLEVAEFTNIVYSQLLSQVKTRNDKVVLSINPIDLVLASVHTSGKWTSCHNIFDGAYKTGPLSYLCDGVTAIAYAYREYDAFNRLKGDCIYLPRKFWRQMVYFDRENRSAILSREYPSSNVNYSNEIRKIAVKILASYANIRDEYLVKWLKNDIISDDDKNFGFVEGKGWHYDDDPVTRIRLKEGGKEPNIITGIGTLPCVECGHCRDDYEEEQEYLTCSSCSGERKYCSCCDERIEGESYTTAGGSQICSYCYNEYYFTCENCDEIYHLDNRVKLPDNTWLCSNCSIEHTESCDCCGDIYYSDNLITVKPNGQKWCENCIDEHAIKCDKCNEYVDEEEIIKTKDDYKICSSCAYECEICGAAFSNKENLINGLCNECIGSEKTEVV